MDDILYNIALLGDYSICMKILSLNKHFFDIIDVPSFWVKKLPSQLDALTELFFQSLEHRWTHYVKIIISDKYILEIPGGRYLKINSPQYFNLLQNSTIQFNIEALVTDSATCVDELFTYPGYDGIDGMDYLLDTENIEGLRCSLKGCYHERLQEYILDKIAWIDNPTIVEILIEMLGDSCPSPSLCRHIVKLKNPSLIAKFIKIHGQNVSHKLLSISLLSKNQESLKILLDEYYIAPKTYLRHDLDYLLHECEYQKTKSRLKLQIRRLLSREYKAYKKLYKIYPRLCKHNTLHKIIENHDEHIVWFIQKYEKK